MDDEQTPPDEVVDFTGDDGADVDEPDDAVSDTASYDGNGEIETAPSSVFVIVSEPIQISDEYPTIGAEDIQNTTNEDEPIPSD